MKPKLLSNPTTTFVVVAHAFGVAFALLALHFSAEGILAFWSEELMGGAQLPTFPRFVLDADVFLQDCWLLVVPVTALAIWLDRNLTRRLAALQNSRVVEVWAYGGLAVALLVGGTFAGCLRFCMLMMAETIGD